MTQQHCCTSSDNDKLQLANSAILSMYNSHNSPSPTHIIQLFDELSSSNFMTSLKPASASSIC